MSDQTAKNPRRQQQRSAWGLDSAAGIPWLAVGLAVGVALGAGAGSLAWGVGVGAAIGLGLRQATTT
jgi:hypothetical protein